MSTRDAPAPLVAAAALAVVEGLVVVLLAVAEVASLTGGRLTMGLTTALFFAVYGLGLIVCGWALTRRRRWARSPVLLAQLIQLGLAWSFRGAGTALVAGGIAVFAVAVMLGLLHPASLTALEPESESGTAA